MAAIRSSDAAGKPSHRARRAADSSSVSPASPVSPCGESAHSPLHLSRKRRQSNAVFCVMPGY